MYISKKHLYISIITIFIVTVGIVLFLKSKQMNNATEKMVDMLNEQYINTIKEVQCRLKNSINTSRTNTLLS